MSAIAERPATGSHQELKGRQQQHECHILDKATVVTQATTVMAATNNIKDDSNIMTIHNSRNESNNRTATQYAGCLHKQ
jgi:hypothetical protein